MNIATLVTMNLHDEVDIWHVYPEFGKEHEDRTDCWCHPYLEYRNPMTGNELWVHNVEH